MSLEILNHLETKIQQTVDTIQSLKQEVRILEQKNQELEQLINDESDTLNLLKQENETLRQDQQMWQQKIQTLLSKIESISQA